MSTWTRCVGYPLIKADFERREGGTVAITLRQQRFKLNPGTQQDEQSNIWKVPIQIISARTKTAQVFLLTEVEKTVIIAAEKGEWIKINAGQTVR